MITCQKIYADVPFAHRQHSHDGHCSQIHGHNWDFIFTFGCKSLDENGFVVDFGRLKFIRRWIDDTFDHACVFNADDPLRERLVTAAPSVWKAVVVPSCSCEGLARHIFETVDPMLRRETSDRAFVVATEVREDRRNSARFVPGHLPAFLPG